MSLTTAKRSKSAILLIDIQQAFRLHDFFGGQRSNDRLEENVQALVDGVRRWNQIQISTSGRSAISKVEIIHVHHHSINPTHPLHPSFLMPITDGGQHSGNVDDQEVVPLRGVDTLPCAQVVEGEIIFTKHVNSAFIGTTLAQYIQERSIRQLMICGITTDHCVSTSTRMAANLKVVESLDGGEKGVLWIIEDACATFPRGMYPADLVHKVQIESLRGEFAEVTTIQEILKHVLVD